MNAFHAAAVADAPGLRYIPGFVSEEDEAYLMDQIDVSDRTDLGEFYLMRRDRPSFWYFVLQRRLW